MQCLCCEYMVNKEDNLKQEDNVCDTEVPHEKVA